MSRQCNKHYNQVANVISENKNKSQLLENTMLPTYACPKGRTITPLEVYVNFFYGMCPKFNQIMHPSFSIKYASFASQNEHDIESSKKNSFVLPGDYRVTDEALLAETT